MSFTGDLQHLPIVDVIQLLHSTRKSGTLTLKSHKGESQLGFRDGYIVSANHANNCIRIGQILLEMKVITEQDLNQTLQQQNSSGSARRPLIAMLVEGNKIKKEDAYKGLETLIEMTVVDILTWTEGSFSLDVDNILLSDDYKYLPETLKQELLLNTQNVLMDALRIYDEKMRDGTLTSFPDITPSSDNACDGNALTLSADDLGLEDLDKTSRVIPDVFSAIKDHVASVASQKKSAESAPLPVPEVTANLFTSNAGSISRMPRHAATESVQALIVFSKDNLISQSLSTVCKQEGFFVFTTDDADNLDLIIDQSIARDLSPVLAMDSPDNPAPEVAEKLFSLLQQKRERYPQVPIILTAARDDYAFILSALQKGFQAVFPRPRQDERHGTYVKDFIKFLESLPNYMRVSSYRPDQKLISLLKESLYAMTSPKGSQDIPGLLLRFTSAVFERSISFKISGGELVADQKIGLHPDKADTDVNLKIPLSQFSVLQEVMEKGEIFYRHCSDAILKNHLFSEIGAPQHSKILLLPIKPFGKTVAVIYADFGTKPASPVQLDLLEILLRQATLVLEHAAYKKNSEIKGSQL